MFFHNLLSTAQPQSNDQIVQSELNEKRPDGQAKILIFSDTVWEGGISVFKCWVY